MAAEALESDSQDYGSFYSLPEVVIIHVFRHLPMRDVVAACYVCKEWNRLARLDVVWKKFIPFAEYVVVKEEKSAYETVSDMWKTSIKVDKERWYPNPLPELVEFDKGLRKAELQQLMLNDNSTMTLMLRLNPLYPFTTKGKDEEDPAMSGICETLWDMFGKMDENAFEFTSYEDVLKRCRYLSKAKAMESILVTLQPYWFVDELKIEPYKLDEDGRIGKGGEEIEVEEEEDDDDDDDDKDYNSWKEYFNKPLSPDVYQKLKAVFADESEHFIEYYLSDGCFNGNYEYAHSLVISDTAVYHIQQIYQL